MDLKDHLKLIADRATKLKEQIQTEEATKNAFPRSRERLARAHNEI